ncbi:hypothetical protein B1R38_27010 [Bacillus cereus]|uniref:hypothetical protein n=1 Tax=Bacillus cereus TaxID=1396 RepID=UPI000D65DC76|nr:hypothetical protein [Bacillus cereus]PWE70239.1 hypothetical protein B1R38_27010 [Bacillus cereus]
MHNLNALLNHVRNKENFNHLVDYLEFGYNALLYIENNCQVIQACNRDNYYFFRFGQDAPNQITRPFNGNLLYDSAESYRIDCQEFIELLQRIREDRGRTIVSNDRREIILRVIYTAQQTVGFILDGLPASQSNTGKKLAGDHFEILMLYVFNYIGIPVYNGVVKVPIEVDGEASFTVNYQHDFINADSDGLVNLIGSVKTTSKDRIDKIFVDKFLYSRLTDTHTPHIGIFLHDVQRKSYKNDPTRFGISSTFLSGKFKGYTLKLNPLDGVYYLDLNANMMSDPILASQIKTFDKLICEDIWQYT